ncbi:MAG: triacylglycerol lipase [Lachnospiraceae bacterium]|nr:triacylglycerol lipase [Lachnospiraceae bacterium]
MKDSKARYMMLRAGNFLLWVFVITTLIALILYVPKLYGAIINSDLGMLAGMTVIAVVEFVLFWTGIIIVYITSRQLGFKTRLWGILLGLIPIANIIMLFIILRVTGEEASFELSKCSLNQMRKDDTICQTRYPILLVHGVFFRDIKQLNYWGRIPDELEKNGATIHYGEQHSAASVDDCAKELEERILTLVKQNGYEKLNVIAHSKGGLDMRTAIAKTSIAPYIASLTTINTPHRGCEFADYLLDMIPKAQQKMIADTYNMAAKKLGDTNPDFMAAVTDLTSSACTKRNEVVKDNPDIYYQSVGSVLAKPSAGQFPLNMTYHLVNLFDGRNDGLVGEKSFAWGQDFNMIIGAGKRGISHGDMIDLNRENFDGFDVREFYVQLVAELKRKGY